MTEQLTLLLNREDAGVVIDALIEHAASARRRTSVTVASSSGIRAKACERLIRQLKGSGGPYHRQTPAHQNLCGSEDPLVDYGHDVTCPDCLALMRLKRRQKGSDGLYRVEER